MISVLAWPSGLTSTSAVPAPAGAKPETPADDAEDEVLASLRSRTTVPLDAAHEGDSYQLR